MLQPSVIPAGLLLLLSLGIGGLSIAMVPLVPLAGIGGLFLSGFGIKCCYSRLLPGATWLSIDPDGFSLCQNFRVQTFSWHEVDHFTIQSNQNDEGSTLPILLMHPINRETPIHCRQSSCFCPIYIIINIRSRGIILFQEISQFWCDCDTIKVGI